MEGIEVWGRALEVWGT